MDGWGHWHPVHIRRKGDPKDLRDGPSKRLSSTGGNVATSFLRVAERQSFKRNTLAKFVPMFAMGSFLSVAAVALMLFGVFEATRLTLGVHTTLAVLFLAAVFLVVRAPFVTSIGVTAVQLAGLVLLALPDFQGSVVDVAGMLLNVVLWWNMKDAARLTVLRRERKMEAFRIRGRRRRVRLVPIPPAWRSAIYVGIFIAGGLLLFHAIGPYFLWIP